MEIIEIFAFHPTTSERIPLYSMSVQAGNPVPIENDIDRVIDLNEYLVDHPIATFFCKVRGNNLHSVGISDGDILIIDSTIVPEDGKIIVASINNELTVKIYRRVNGEEFLQSDDKRFVPLIIGEMEYEIIGVVSKVIHTL